MYQVSFTFSNICDLFNVIKLASLYSLASYMYTNLRFGLEYFFVRIEKLNYQTRYSSILKIFTIPVVQQVLVTLFVEMAPISYKH